MITPADRTRQFLVYLSFLPCASTMLLAPQAASQRTPQALNARDLYAEKIDPPPGLKSRILLRELSGGYRPVRMGSVFQTNDRIRLEFESNTFGYLYVLQQGSDSSWDVLFPSAEIRDNNNRLEPIHPVQLPRQEDFVFDHNPGQEKLYAVLSLNREPDLERLLNHDRAQRSKTTQPDDALPPLFKTISSKVSVDLASRNLKVYQNGPDDTPEAQNAVYAVNARPHDGRVISELVLNHRR